MTVQLLYEVDYLHALKYSKQFGWSITETSSGGDPWHMEYGLLIWYIFPMKPDLNTHTSVKSIINCNGLKSGMIPEYSTLNYLPRANNTLHRLAQHLELALQRRCNA